MNFKSSGKSRFKRMGVTVCWLSLLVMGNGCAHKFLRGTASIRTGVPASEIATIHLHVRGGVYGRFFSIFDNGTVIIGGVEFEPINWAIIRPNFNGTTDLGNEVCYCTLDLPYDIWWHRLPGPLVITVLGDRDSGFLTGSSRAINNRWSKEINYYAVAGGVYDCDVTKRLNYGSLPAIDVVIRREH